MLDSPREPNNSDYLARPRVTELLANAAKYPLVVVCAGAGYGKTYAVYEFCRSTSISYIWLQLSQFDNAGSRFWAKYIQAVAGWNNTFAEQCKALGFPDTPDKLNKYTILRRRHAPSRKHLVIVDDAHLIHHPDILRFMERRLTETVVNTTIILVCREMPAISLTKLLVKGLIPGINEQDLSFTEGELATYLSEQGLQVSRHDLHSIYADTGGWAFAVNLVARSLKKAPGYAGYVQLAMKQNIFKLMELEVFESISERLQRFLVRLSLIDHLSAELVSALAGGDTEFLAELKQTHAYMRFDSSIHAYTIHHLFLDFLRTKQSLLTQDEITQTYREAAAWCTENGFVTDALRYSEKVEDFEGIVSILREMPVQMPVDVALCAAEILERIALKLFDRIPFLAVMHVRVIVRLGRWNEAIALMQQYERQFLRLPDDDPFRNKALAGIYYSWGNVRALLATMDDCYDFDNYFAKMAACLEKSAMELDQYADMPIGMWASLVGSSREGAPQEYIEAARKSANYISQSWGGANKGIDLLCKGELLFYQGSIRAAKATIIDALQQAAENNQFEIEHKALFYLLRIALWQGERIKAEEVLRKMEDNLEGNSNAHCYFNYDAALGWYYLTLRCLDMVPAWAREVFTPYHHAYFAENFGNQIKARYHYLARDYAPLLAFIEGSKRRESILYGRIEMLALEACTHLQMKNKAAALDALNEAYTAARPNNILMPFIELGKDMRTLAASALRDTSCKIEPQWLEKTMRKAASFAKHQSLIISDFEKTNGRRRNVALSTREREVLLDMYHGLTRPEIAARQELSNNTVNSTINSIFNKLGAHSTADAVRVAAEEKLV